MESDKQEAVGISAIAAKEEAAKDIECRRTHVNLW